MLFSINKTRARLFFVLIDCYFLKCKFVNYRSMKQSHKNILSARDDKRLRESGDLDYKIGEHGVR